jgi:hypothetical protein
MRIQNGLPCTKKLAKFGAARGADLPGVGTKDTESGGKERQIRRPFHSHVQFPRRSPEGNQHLAASDM